jgi:hypothetical protein
MIDIDELVTLFSQVARKLGHIPQVEVRLRKPTVEGATGQVYKTSPVSCIIDISPDLSLDDMFLTFLHEVSHLKHDWHRLGFDYGWRQPSRSVTKSEPERAIRRAMPFEQNAWKQADTWASWARLHAYDYTPPCKPLIVGLLKSLMHYPDEMERKVWQPKRKN